MTYTTQLLVLEALRLAQADIKARRGSASTLGLIGQAIVAHTADMTPPAGCHDVAIPLYLTDMWGTSVAGPARLIATQDLRFSDGPLDEYVTVGARIDMACAMPLDRVDKLVRRARADDTLEVA